MITGVFLGISDHSGRYGPYRRITVRTRDGSLTVTGAVIMHLIDAAGLAIGETIKIVFGGYKDCSLTPSAAYEADRHRRQNGSRYSR
jgi:hypothetical protein